ncbi:MAG: hypothetical protein HC888_19600, partial [Candidatus Competibacteraceae bacterium]|nr:hypothetical protein [Candidatus Competibacteraceae bacterium]
MHLNVQAVAPLVKRRNATPPAVHFHAQLHLCSLKPNNLTGISMKHATESKETSSNTNSPPAEGVDLIKDALIKAGKSDDEISSVTTVDAAQTAVDQGRGKPGVLQQALLQKQLSLDLFGCLAAEDQLKSGKAAETLKLSLEAMHKHGNAGTILGEDG